MRKGASLFRSLALPFGVLVLISTAAGTALWLIGPLIPIQVARQIAALMALVTLAISIVGLARALRTEATRNQRPWWLLALLVVALAAASIVYGWIVLASVL